MAALALGWALILCGKWRKQRIYTFVMVAGGVIETLAFEPAASYLHLVLFTNDPLHGLQLYN
jgi:hypothetical protein